MLCAIHPREHPMNIYDRYVLPYLIDLACGIGPIERQRDKVVPRAEGNVLEIGIGTGLNAAHYDQHKVGKVWGLDPAMGMHRLAKKRVAAAGLDVELVGLPAERIDMPEAHVDTVLITFTLCTIGDPVAALNEMRRVLKPEGRLVFCEHGRAPEASVRRWQDRVTPAWKKVAGGCHLNRDIPALLERGRFDTQELQTAYLPGPRPWAYNYWGVATPA